MPLVQLGLVVHLFSYRLVPTLRFCSPRPFLCIISRCAPPFRSVLPPALLHLPRTPIGHRTASSTSKKTSQDVCPQDPAPHVLGLCAERTLFFPVWLFPLSASAAPLPRQYASEPDCPRALLQLTCREMPSPITSLCASLPHTRCRKISETDLVLDVAVQGYRSRRCRWHWPASLPADEAEPPCHRACPLRHSWWSRYVTNNSKHPSACMEA